LLAQLHAPDLAYHFHGDHLLALLLKYSAEQLNTLVNFESALLGLDGQFSVGVNSDAKDFKEVDPKGLGLAAFVAGVGPGLAEKQCPGFDFVPIRTHLALKK
jgi:hypothetical protein